MKIVVIGLGSMGRRRIRLIKTLYPSYNIIGIDSNEKRVMDVSKEQNIKCYGSINEIEKIKNIKCAFVCTSPISHAAIIRECLLYDWNVFTEINLLTDGYDENAQIAKDKKLTLFLSSTPMYKAEMQEIKKMLLQKKVSYIYHVGQYLLDWHPWENYNQFFVGDKRTNGCREILAIELPWMVKTFGAIKKVQVQTNKLTALDIDYNDNYMINIQHENGSMGIFVADVVSRQAIRHLEIYNEQIFIEWNGQPNSLCYKNCETNEMVKIDSIAHNKYENKYKLYGGEYAYANEIEEFFAVMNGNKDIQYSFEDDKQVLKIIDIIEGI